MVSDDFEWDDDKAAANVRNHQGVTFEESRAVFADPLAVGAPDDEHSDDEDRYTLIGRSAFGELVRVTYTERGHRIRIVSARRLTKSQQRGFRDGTYP